MFFLAGDRPVTPGQKVESSNRDMVDIPLERLCEQVVEVSEPYSIPQTGVCPRWYHLIQTTLIISSDPSAWMPCRWTAIRHRPVFWQDTITAESGQFDTWWHTTAVLPRDWSETLFEVWIEESKSDFDGCKRGRSRRLPCRTPGRASPSWETQVFDTHR